MTNITLKQNSVKNALYTVQYAVSKRQCKMHIYYVASLFCLCAYKRSSNRQILAFSQFTLKQSNPYSILELKYEILVWGNRGQKIIQLLGSKLLDLPNLSQVSCVTCHKSCDTCHVSCVMSHASCVTCHVTCH